MQNHSYSITSVADWKGAICYRQTDAQFPEAAGADCRVIGHDAEDAVEQSAGYLPLAQVRLPAGSNILCLSLSRQAPVMAPTIAPDMSHAMRSAVHPSPRNPAVSRRMRSIIEPKNAPVP